MKWRGAIGGGARIFWWRDWGLYGGVLGQEKRKSERVCEKSGRVICWKRENELVELFCPFWITEQNRIEEP